MGMCIQSLYELEFRQGFVKAAVHVVELSTYESVRKEEL